MMADFMKTEEVAPLVRWHSQNLNEDAEGRVKGSILQHGRGWLFLRPGRNGQTRAVGMEWSVPSRFTHIETEISGDENEIKFALASPLSAFWLHFEGFLPRRWWGVNRKSGIAVHNGAIWFEIWSDPNGWNCTDPKWQKFNFNPADFFLGSQKYSQRELETVAAVVPMPEGSYPAAVTLFESTWKRPRWPFARRMTRAEVNMGKPVPVPGKGENSWDCEDDALYSMTTPNSNVTDAVAETVKSVLRTRERYGSADWLPPGKVRVNA